MSKRGTRYLRRALRLAAETAARTDPQCRAIRQKQRAKGKHDSHVPGRLRAPNRHRRCWSGLDVA